MVAPTSSFSSELLVLPTGVSNAERLAACKSFLKTQTAHLKASHDSGTSGLAITKVRAGFIDVLLRQLFDHAIKSYQDAHGAKPTPVTLVALGGYGRSELSPLSDIDLMFLFPTKTSIQAIKPFIEHLTNEILYPLWDCDLKVGHSTRTVDEVFIEARKDVQTKTSLLESRRIAGSRSLFSTFEQAYRSYYITEKPKAYIASRLEDQAARRAKFGDTVFLQEPDIKNGVGGLRDYQNAVWMAQVKLSVSSIAELATENYLREAEVGRFNESYDFLHRVRNELHFLVTRPTDLLDLEIQTRIAWNLGYRMNDELARVERFMQDYYRSARAIYRISKIIENRLALTLDRPANGKISFREVIRAQRMQRAKRIDGFILRGRELAAEKPDVFHADPARLIRVFRHCQQLNCQPDLNLNHKIRDCRELITPDVVNSKEANTSFKAILSESGSVYPTLSLMHELGVLGLFIPEFDKLTCLVQHEFYHRYTADAHTLRTIRELDRVFSEAEPITLKYRSALRESSDPVILYLILLLHDIGKGIAIKGHAESGVRIAEPILERLGISSSNRALISYIIKNHLIMAQFWQKRDVDDPETAAAFAETIEEPDKLHLLYVHTFCDARGTAASLWNGYKDTLHTGLYRRTLEQLRLGDKLQARHEERVQMNQQDIIARNIPDITEEEIVAHFQLLPERYSIHTDNDEISQHIQMVHALLQTIADAESVGSLQPVIEWQNDLNRSLTIVNVVTWDRPGLFNILAGAFNVAGLSILSAKVSSRSDHIAIDTFYVVESGRGIVQNTKAQELFEETVNSSLVKNRDLYPEILEQAKKHYSRYTLNHNDGPHTSFPPKVEVYQELSMNRIIVEVQAIDQVGLLYLLSRAISAESFDITFSRIATERGIAIDTFHIENSDLEKAVDETRLHTLRDVLTGIITPGDEAAET